MYITNLSGSILTEISNIIKLLKSDFLYIQTNNQIYKSVLYGNTFGFNKDFTIIRTTNVKVNNDLMPMIIRALDFNALMKTNLDPIPMQWGSKSELISVGFGNVSYANTLYSGLYLQNELDNRILHLQQTIVQGNCLLNIEHFHENPKFKEAIELPASKGCTYLPEFGITVYKGFIPLGAKDDLHFRLYSLDNLSFTADFEISKPKGVIVHSYVNYLNLNA